MSTAQCVQLRASEKHMPGISCLMKTPVSRVPSTDCVSPTLSITISLGPLCTWLFN